MSLGAPTTDKPVITAEPPVPVLRGRRAVWQVADHLDPSVAAQMGAMSRMVAHLLHQRGCSSADEVAFFINRPGPEHDPYLIPDMTEAVERIRAASGRGERCAVYGDFDCDGLTSAAILQSMLRELGLEPVVVIPTREEGHGINPSRLPELAEAGVTLLLTCDCGIADVEQVAEAGQLGMDVIITDHHTPRADGVLPSALIVSPTRHDSHYPWRYLSGAGVAYKLSEAVLRAPELYEQLLDLVTMGTIADVVPLRGENRTLVIKGLGRLRETERRGLRALFSVAGVDSSKLEEATVGYYLGPRINAANRIAEPQLAFDLITASDPALAHELARQLDDHNSTRQDQVAREVQELVSSIGPPAEVVAEMRGGARPPLLCVEGEWSPGISGLLASELVERYGVPALAASPKLDGTVSASGRSIRDVNILSLLQACEDRVPRRFVRFGGHAKACGFTIRPENLPSAFADLERLARERVPLDSIESRLSIDARVRLGQLDMQALETVESLGPYGSEFREPLFLASAVYLSDRRRMGADGKHVKATVRSGSTRLSAIIFGCDAELADLPEEEPLDLVFALQRDQLNGLSRPQIRIVDWRRCGS